MSYVEGSAMRTLVLVRLSGFEPPRSCDRQPLKLVRLPIPPQPQFGATSKNQKHSVTSLARPAEAVAVTESDRHWEQQAFPASMRGAACPP
jgi:hypothetical protein